MSNQDRYDELDNIVNTLGTLAGEIDDKYYIDMLDELRYEAQDELEQVEQKLLKEYEQEEREMKLEFERNRF